MDGKILLNSIVLLSFVGHRMALGGFDYAHGGFYCFFRRFSVVIARVLEPGPAAVDKFAQRVPALWGSEVDPSFDSVLLRVPQMTICSVALGSEHSPVPFAVSWRSHQDNEIDDGFYMKLLTTCVNSDSDLDQIDGAGGSVNEC